MFSSGVQAQSSPEPQIMLSQTGLGFTAVQGSAPLPQSFGILNAGGGSMDWSASAGTMSGGRNWLIVSPTRGTVVRPYRDVSQVSVRVDPSGLRAGDYYGQIRITSSASNSPQSVNVVLSVLPVGVSVAPDIQPAGLIFTGAAGSPQPSQDVLIGNPNGQSTNFFSARIDPGPGTTFTYQPLTATISPGQSVALHVTPNFADIQPGTIKFGTITLLFPDGTVRTISVMIVVSPASGISDSCPNPNLQATMRSLPAYGYTATAGVPTTIEVQVVDRYGNLIGPADPQGAVVNASFSNNDASIQLTHIGNGIWTGTWLPVNSSAQTLIKEKLSSYFRSARKGLASAFDHGREEDLRADG
jgi:hypothetical protein